MREWKEYKLGEIAEIIMGQSPKGETCNNSGIGVPLLNGPTEFSSFYPLPTQFTTDPKRHSEIDDLLFCVRGSTTGKMNWSDQKYAIGRGIGAIRHKNGPKLNHFIKAIIEYNLPILLQSATGSTFPNVSRDQLIGLKIKVPSLSTQSAIAEILSSLDDKIELNNKINQELEDLAQTLFKRWFIDFEFPNENGEPYKSSGGEMVESELGEIPKGWEVGKFGDLVKIINGYAFKSIDFNNFFSEGIIKIRNINGTIVDIVNTDFVSFEVVRNLNDKFKIESGDILIAMTGAEVGKIGVVAKTQKSLWLNQRVGKILPNNIYHLSYLHTMFNVLNLEEVIRNEAMGSAQPNISSQGIESIKLLIPQTTLINKFSSLFNDKFNLFYDSLAENQELANLRDTLLPKLISGELEVNNINF